MRLPTGEKKKQISYNWLLSSFYILNLAKSCVSCKLRWRENRMFAAYGGRGANRAAEPHFLTILSFSLSAIKYGFAKQIQMYFMKIKEINQKRKKASTATQSAAIEAGCRGEIRRTRDTLPRSSEPTARTRTSPPRPRSS